MIIIGLFTRLAVIPLPVIMIVAFITTKWPELLDKGFWPLMQDGRTDFAMTLLLFFLLTYGSGNRSIDFNRHAQRKKLPKRTGKIIYQVGPNCIWGPAAHIAMMQKEVVVQRK